MKWPTTTTTSSWLQKFFIGHTRSMWLFSLIIVCDRLIWNQDTTVVWWKKNFFLSTTTIGWSKSIIQSITKSIKLINKSGDCKQLLILSIKWLMMMNQIGLQCKIKKKNQNAKKNWNETSKMSTIYTIYTYRYTWEIVYVCVHFKVHQKKKHFEPMECSVKRKNGDWKFFLFFQFLFLSQFFSCLFLHDMISSKVLFRSIYFHIQHTQTYTHTHSLIG